MTPLAIDILLHYHTRPGEYGERDNNSQAPAVQSEITRMLYNELLTFHDTDHGASMVITDKGNAYVRGLCNMPFPEQHWVIPNYDPTPPKP